MSINVENEIKVAKPQGYCRPVVMKNIDGEMQPVREYSKFRNLITDRYMARILGSYGSASTEFASDGANMDSLKYAYVGTGTTPPTTNTVEPDGAVSTPSQKAQSLTLDLIDVEGTGTFVYTCKFVFGLGDLDGVYTNYGIARYFNLATADFYAFSLFKDTSDQPTTVSVGADEQLVLFYEIHWPVKEGYTHPQTTGADRKTIAFEKTINNVEINGTNHTFDISFQPIRYNTSRNKKLETETSDRNERRYIGRIYSDTDDLLSNANSFDSSSADTYATQEKDATNKEVAYDLKVRVGPTCELENITKVEGFDRYWTAAIIDITPPIPLLEGHAFEMNISWKITWE